MASCWQSAVLYTCFYQCPGLFSASRLPRMTDLLGYTVLPPLPQSPRSLRSSLALFIAPTFSLITIASFGVVPSKPSCDAQPLSGLMWRDVCENHSLVKHSWRRYFARWETLRLYFARLLVPFLLLYNLALPISSNTLLRTFLNSNLRQFSVLRYNWTNHSLHRCLM